LNYTYDFVETLGCINIRKIKYYPKYLAYFEKFENENEYKIHLEKYLKDFRHEIRKLPLKSPVKKARQTLLNNLYDELLLTEEILHLQCNQVITKSKKCIFNKNRILKYCFPRFLRKKYLTKARQVYQKINFVYFIQKDIIESAIKIIKISALNDGVELKTIEKQLNERFKTDLSSSELSYLFYLLFEEVSTDKNFNRSNLSKLLADNFSTKKTLTPQYKQIKKHFFDVNDSVKKRIEKMFFELSHKAKSN
jgi:hypothetical protein